jgi:hypothetical protein
MCMCVCVCVCVFFEFTENQNKCLMYLAMKQKVVRFEVSTVVTKKNGVFWDVTLCGSCKFLWNVGSYKIHIA